MRCMLFAAFVAAGLAGCASNTPAPTPSTTVAQAQPSASKPASARHDWVTLGGKPLKRPYDPNVIRIVVHDMTVFPTDVADELSELVIGGKGRRGTVCKGDTLAAMSFGESEVWQGPVHVVWKNERARCKPATFFDTTRGATVYTALRVDACKNLGALYPHVGEAPPIPPGPHLGLTPPTNCPPLGAFATCC